MNKRMVIFQVCLFVIGIFSTMATACPPPSSCSSYCGTWPNCYAHCPGGGCCPLGNCCGTQCCSPCCDGNCCSTADCKTCVDGHCIYNCIGCQECLGGCRDSNFRCTGQCEARCEGGECIEDDSLCPSGELCCGGYCYATDIYKCCKDHHPFHRCPLTYECCGESGCCNPNICQTCVDGNCVVCNITIQSVTSNVDVACVGCNVTFTAAESGSCSCVSWSGGGTPATGSGSCTFVTNWSTAGTKTVTARSASACGNSSAKQVTIVKVDKVVKAGTTEEGPLHVCGYTDVSLEAKPDPAGTSFPTGEPHWTIESQPSGANATLTPSSGSATTTLGDFTEAGDYVVKAKCGGSDAGDTITVTVPDCDPDLCKTCVDGECKVCGGDTSGCEEGSQTVSLSLIETSSPSCNNPPGNCGETHYPVRYSGPDIYANYNNCKWVFSAYDIWNSNSDPCPGNFTEITNGNDPDLNANNYCGIVNGFRNHACVTVGGTKYGHASCTEIHEDCHYAFMENDVETTEEGWLEARNSMSDMTIDCSNSNTTTCQAAKSARESSILTDLAQAYDNAWDYMDAQGESPCYNAAASCYEGVADSICAAWDCDGC